MSEAQRTPLRGGRLGLSIDIVDWAAAEPLVMPVRMAVFVVEQGVPEEIERDDFDTVSRHAVARDATGVVVATGRLLPDGHIGRMAVLAQCRGAGVGGAVLEALVEEAMRTGFGITKKADGSYVVLRPNERCAEAPELFDEVWGLTAAIIPTIKPL